MKKNYKLAIIVIIVLSFISYIVINKNGAKEALVLTEEHKIENITAFAKLYGYVRYFHPSDEASKLDWDTFAMYGVQQVKDDRSDRELKETLETLFHPIAPTIEITLGEQQDYSNPNLIKENKYVFWQHQGVETELTKVSYGNTEFFNSERVYLTKDQNDYSLENQIFESYPSTDQWVYNKKLSDEVGVYIPLVLPINQEKETIGSSEESTKAFEELQNKLASLKESGIHTEQVDARVSGVIKTWNVYQHFYPYFEEAEVDWEEQLPTFIGRVIQDKTYNDYVTSIRLLVEKAQDAQSVVEDKDDYRLYTLPIRVEMVENQLVVTETLETSPFNVGDIILSKDGASVEELFTELINQISGSPQYKEATAELTIIQGPFEEASDFEVIRNGDTLHVSSTYTEKTFPYTLKKSVLPIHEIKEGIYYIALHEEVDSRYVDQYLEELATAKGIIFDARSYLNGGFSRYIGHLVKETIPFPEMEVPLFVLPDQQGKVGYAQLGEGEFLADEPRFQGEIVVLVNGNLISWGEDYLRVIKENQLATIIGQPTGGTSGNINRFRLFDEIVISFTGQKIEYTNGNRNHLIGIQPDILVEQTIEAIQAGRDVFIDKAVEFIEGEVN